ncbi:MAG: hypothetical protein PHV33_07415 [Elusimicrobiales bacterium]|nr:hypothetical protein [Elusimicrobiales bacterium]
MKNEILIADDDPEVSDFFSDILIIVITGLWSSVPDFDKSPQVKAVMYKLTARGELLDNIKNTLDPN